MKDMAEQKIAIVTGCSSGIGLATALLFLKKGHRVFGIDRSPFETERLEAGAGGSGGSVEGFHFHRADLLDEGACDAAVAACVEVFGPRIDVLANVAGIMDSFSSADTVTDAEWDRVLGVNMTGPVKMMRAVLVYMKEARSGAIVNVSSKAGVSGGAAGIAYTTSKHGLIGATRHVAWRFHEEGIRCNAVLPGAVGTNIGKGVTAEMLDQTGYMATLPVTKLHMPRETTDIEVEDVANAIFFLASEEAKMINGACLPVDRAWGVI